MSRLLEMVVNALGIGDARGAAGRREAGCVVFARIEDPLMPLQRGTKYEDPLNRALVQARMGRVTGGGSVQGVDGTIEWVSLDMQLSDTVAALAFVRRKLKELGAPKGSVLKFKKDGGVATIQIE